MQSERRVLAGVLIAGTLLRVLQTATSIGSLDALIWYRWVELIERVGLLPSYLYSELMNHPPFILAIAFVVNRAGVALGLEFQDSFRALQIMADVVTAVVLYRLATRSAAPAAAGTPGRAVFAPIVFFLSPATIFITAFHCNSDPLMMMFIVIAIAAAIAERPILCGTAIAAASGVKVIALIVAPLLFLAFRRSARGRLVLAGVAGGLVIFLPGFVVSGPLFLKQVFAYTGMPGGWGIRLALELLTGNVALAIAAARVSTLVMLLAFLALYISFARCPATTRLPAATGLLFLFVLVFAPGFGVQYYFWILPFLAFTTPRSLTLAVHALVSAYLFIYYTAFSGGWPWWYAEPPADRALAMTIVNWGIVPWLALAVAAGVAIRRWRASPQHAAAHD